MVDILNPIHLTLFEGLGDQGLQLINIFFSGLVVSSIAGLFKLLRHFLLRLGILPKQPNSLLLEVL